MNLDDVTLWPPLGLRVVGAGLELAWASDELVFDLARAAADGVHDESFMPFVVPWTRGTPEQVGRSTLQFAWGRRHVLSPDDWCLQMAVLRDGEVLGLQDAFARHLGYRENGTATAARAGAPVESRQFRMEREDWEARPEWMRPEVTIHGVEPVRGLLEIA